MPGQGARNDSTVVHRGQLIAARRTSHKNIPPPCGKGAGCRRDPLPLEGGGLGWGWAVELNGKCLPFGQPA
jgi:hypothetical protein